MRHKASWRRPRYCSADIHRRTHLPLGKGSDDVTCPAKRGTQHARARPRTSPSWGPGLPRAPGPSNVHARTPARGSGTVPRHYYHWYTTGRPPPSPRDQGRKSRTTATRAAFPQYTFYSVRPLYPAIQGRTTTSAPLHSCTPPLLTTIKGEDGLPFVKGGTDLSNRRVEAGSLNFPFQNFQHD